MPERVNVVVNSVSMLLLAVPNVAPTSGTKIRLVSTFPTTKKKTRN
jgi:hypothetical protein